MPQYHLIPDIGDFNENVDDVNLGVHDYIWNKRRALFLGTCAVSVALCAALWILEVRYYGTLTRAMGSRALWYSLLVLLLPEFWYAHFKAQMQHLFMRQLAQAIGFNYESTASLQTVQGKIFELGSSRQIEDVLSGTYQSHPIRIFGYRFTVHAGKSSYTAKYTIFALAFEGTMPDIVLAPKSFLLASTLGIAPGGCTKIVLEGDFNEHFHLYAPEGYEVEIREIFQPDLMAELVEKYQSYRIEIAGGALYVVCPLITNKAKFLAAHDLTDRLFARLAPQLKAIAAAPTPV
ncbi:MAG: hypothetical protein WBD71_07635 [Xanthobacteraceae bacterium]